MTDKVTTKSENQAEKSRPTELKDEQLDEVQGGGDNRVIAQDADTQLKSPPGSRLAPSQTKVLVQP